MGLIKDLGIKLDYETKMQPRKKGPVRNFKQMNYKPEKRAMTKQEAAQFINSQILGLRKKGIKGTIRYTVKMRDTGKYAGVRDYVDLESNEMISEVDIEDYWNLSPEEAGGNQIEKIIMTLTQGPPQRGGKNEHNDCLFMAISDVIKKMPCNMTRFKKACLGDKYERDALIPVSCLSKAEELCKVKINVSGDVIRNSIFESDREVYLRLKDEHYTVDHRKQTTGLKKQFSGKEREPVVYEMNKIKGKIMMVSTFNGKKHSEITYKEFQDILKKPFSSDIVFIPNDPIRCADKNKRIEFNKNVKLRMEENFKIFKRDANIMKKETNGFINMYKTGRDRITAQVLFDALTNRSIKPEQILDDEAEWINLASTGPLIRCRMNYQGDAYYSDVISAYPSILMSKSFNVPVKCGKFVKLTQEEFETQNNKFIKFGIYRCSIEETENMLFRMNPKEYYTSYDLQVAKSMGLKMELIDDDKPNALLYERHDDGRHDYIRGSEVFRKYMDFLFDLKKKLGKTTNRPKQLINILWGLLCRTAVNKMYVHNEDFDKFEFYDTNKVYDVVSVGEKMNRWDLVEENKFFETNYARMKPFILAKMRQKMYNTFKDYESNIVRIHTDGVMLDTKPELKYGTKIGELKDMGIIKDITVEKINVILNYNSY